MLIRFSFKNFKSFKNENCLDMEATSLKEHEYNIAKTDTGDFLKISAIYGANASGKTNVLLAFNYMRRKVLLSDDYKNKNITEENEYSFMMNDDPISMEVELLAENGKIYKYGFEILNDEVISEWLYVKKINKYYKIFDRDGSRGDLKISYKTREYHNIDKNTLFLNIFSKLESIDDFDNVYDWFVKALYLDLGNPEFERDLNKNISRRILIDRQYRKELLKFIKSFDSNIVDIETTPKTISDTNNKDIEIKIKFLHKNKDNTSKAILLDLESNGTKKMFYLFDFIIDALKSGMVLFVDELDAKLHPLLTRYIINLFHNEETNIGNGQLIYSTHDTVNLNKDTFRRDEIWFAEKDEDGVSEIYALSDYILEDEKNEGKKVRNDATYNKDYLTGRYGAIPVLEAFEIDYEK